MLEYIFENRKYDMALRDVKATLFDIVSEEESKIAALMSKIYKSSDPDYQAELVDVCNAQDECLKRVLKIFSELEKTLKKLDSYSRELKRIENDNLTDMISNYKEVVNEQAKTIRQYAASSQVQETVDQEAMIQAQQMVEQEEMAPAQGFVEQPAEEQEMVAPEAQLDMTNGGEQPEMVAPDVQPEMSAPDVQPEMSAPDVQPEMVNEGGQPEMTTPVEEMAAEQNGEAVEELQPEAPVEEAQPEMVAEAPVEDGAPVMEATPTDEMPSEENATGDVIIPYDDSISTVEEAPAENAESNNETSNDVIIPFDDSISTVTPDSEEAKDNTEENTNVLTIPQAETTETVLTEESESQATLISGADEEKIEGNVASSILPQIVSTPVADENKEEADTSTPPLIPQINNSGEEVEVLNPTSEKLTFKKNGTEAAKVIITSATQTGNLRKSLNNQEAILKGNGFFGEDSNLEEQLVKNGLLPEDKESQVEGLMNQANQLYAEGKIEESQKIFDQISEMNKSSGESVGLTI